MGSTEIVLEAPAKINLFLKITGRRADGYHELYTVMQKLRLADRLSLRRAQREITIRCPDSGLPENEDNLVYRAAKAWFAETGVAGGVEITLEKKVPIAAGLGGGSSDAAAVLHGLGRLYDVEVDLQRLCQLGLGLGADVPFFVDSHPAVLATGIGEVLEPVAPLTHCPILLVNPGFAVATKWVYENFALTTGDNPYILGPGFESTEEYATVDGLPEFLANCRVGGLFNDLQKVTVGKYPQVGELKRELADHGGLPLMSGSGPTVFALFGGIEQARACFDRMSKRYHDIFLTEPLN